MLGGWLSDGDLALESASHFLAVVEHRLVPARTRSISKSLRFGTGASSIFGSSLPGFDSGWSRWCWDSQSERCLPFSPYLLYPSLVRSLGWAGL